MSTSVTIVGNVTRDPELKYTQSGQAVARFGIAVNRRTKQADGVWVDADPHFFDITCWRELAENAAESLTKGTRVVVTGRLEQQTWEQDGTRRSKVEIQADEVAPSLRWATATVVKAERAARAATPKTPAGDFGDEPF